MVATPLALPPGYRFGEWTLKMVHSRDVSMLEGRRLESADFGTPYWTLTARTASMTIAKADAFESFLFQASRGGATFVCPDLYRKRPRAYGETPLSGTKAIGGAFNGSATIQTITNSRQVTVAGLPAGFVLKAGDLIEFNASALVRSLHMITANVTSGGGGQAVVKFEPPLNTTVFTTSATAQFEMPSCVMMLTEYDMPKGAGAKVATFTATEAFFS